MRGEFEGLKQSVECMRVMWFCDKLNGVAKQRQPLASAFYKLREWMVTDRVHELAEERI